MARVRLRILLVAALLLTVLPVYSQVRRGTDPIDKTGLLETLKDKVVRSKTLVAQIQRRGVSFKMTPEDEQQIRDAGKYLGKTGLDNLIKAIRKYHHPETSQKPAPTPPTISQTMTNSPGSLQVGGNLIVNPGNGHWGLNDEQLSLLSRRLAPFAQQKDRGDLITCVLGDSASTRFAVNLVAAFRKAGWNLPGSGYNQSIFSGVVEGIILKVNSKDAKPLGLLEFVMTMREAGIEPVGEIDTSIPPENFRIVVGLKPSR